MKPLLIQSILTMFSNPEMHDGNVWEIIQRGFRFCLPIICGDCGGQYGPKVWHSNDSYRKVIWRCNRKFSKGQQKCQTPTINEETIKKLFLGSIQHLRWATGSSCSVTAKQCMKRWRISPT